MGSFGGDPSIARHLMTRIPLALLVLFGLFSILRADELRLRDGRSFDGQVVSQDGNRIVFRVPGKRLVFEERNVLSLVKRPSVFDGYAERAAALEQTPGAESEIALAQWCEQQGLVDERKAHAQRALVLVPDHPEAHRLLDHLRVGDRWLPREEALRKLGWQKRGERWLTPDEVAAERKEKEAAARWRRLEARANGLIEQLYSPSSKTAERAKKELEELAKAENIAGLVEIVQRLYADGVAYRTALVEVRARRSELTGFRRQSVSLGNGSPVTIELPSQRLTGIGTTVVVPVR